MKNIILRAIYWTATNSAMAALAWYAVNGSMGAANVLVFVTWFVLSLVSLSFFLPDEEIEKIQKKGRSVPAWMSFVYDTAFVLFLVWNGWFLTAIATTLTAILVAGFWNKKIKPKE